MNNDLDKKTSSAALTSAEGAGGVVNSVVDPIAVRIRELLTPAGRQRYSEILIDDEENIQECLTAGGDVRVVFHTDDCEISSALIECLPPQAKVAKIGWRTSKKIFGTERRSRIFAIAGLPEKLTLAHLPSNVGDYVVLDNLRIAGNVGAIIRTAFAFGASAVLILDAELADIFDRRLIRSSRGYIFRMPLICCSTIELISHCRENKLPLMITSASGELRMDDVARDPRNLFIAFGVEKSGCSDELLAAAEGGIRIPMKESAESVNVSVAAGIILYARAVVNVRV